jgi:predicted TIM-barrel fold metal-dependent hydrolase
MGPARLPEGQIAVRKSVPPGERRVGERRIAAMDEAGLDVQVISLTSPGLHNLPADEAIHLPVETNDRIAELVKDYSDRFHGFATLPSPRPLQPRRSSTARSPGSASMAR